MKWPLPRWPDIKPLPFGSRLPPLWKRLAWMAGIWTASVTALLLVALLVRQVLKI